MARDPYKYYRIEARELLQGLDAGVLELDEGSPSDETIARLLRLAHTLKGAARVVKQATTAELAHGFEGLLTPYRDTLEASSRTAVAHATVNELLRIVDAVRAEVDALEPPKPETGATEKTGTSLRVSTAASEEALETVRVDIHEMDGLLEDVSQVGGRLAAFASELGRLEGAERLAAAAFDDLAESGAARARRHLDELRDHLAGLQRDLTAGLDHTRRQFDQLRERADDIRLVPAEAVFGTLKRAARDAAEAVGKKVELRTVGGDQRLDGHVLSPLKDALIHAVRNSVDHGIERESVRLARGKPPVGRLELRVERRGDRLAFLLSDDGRGLDAAALGRAAVERGRLSRAQAAELDAAAAAELLLEGGLTTRLSSTEISGRGIGFDSIRETASRLRGRLAIESRPHQGTTLEIDVPLSLASMKVLEVDASRMTACLPIDAIRWTLRLEHREIVSSPDGPGILYENRALPFLSLSHLVDAAVPEQAVAAPGGRVLTVVIAHGRGGDFALGVDRVRRAVDVVVKPLPAILGEVANVAGITFDAAGDPRPVLDVDDLSLQARDPRRPIPDEAGAPRPRVLVVDDSLTTRMLERSVLESAGYEVDLAGDGEEGLSMARQRRYRLFVVDVEMPGIDGFEFVSRIRKDSRLRDVPVILLTSRARHEDRRRGLEAGARAYLVKREFEQRRFLDVVRGLIG